VKEEVEVKEERVGRGERRSGERRSGRGGV